MSACSPFGWVFINRYDDGLRAAYLRLIINATWTVDRCAYKDRVLAATKTIWMELMGKEKIGMSSTTVRGG
jgi:hypothetical protein